MLVAKMTGELTMSGCQVPAELLNHSPFSAGQGRENKMKNNSEVEMRQLTKAKAKVCVQTSRGKLLSYLLFSYNQQALAAHFLGSRALAHVGVAPRDKPFK